MELIHNNPFRIAGILSNATERELQKQKTKIKAYSKVGKNTDSVYDFKFLKKIIRTEPLVDSAFSNVEQNQDKVNYALFWFLNVSPFDKTAIEYLVSGDDEKAVEIWEKVTRNKDVNSKNFSAFNNLGTYKLLSTNTTHVTEGIEAKIKLIESNHFENFIHSVADETFNIDSKKQSEKLIDDLLIHFKSQYSTSETLQFFNNCNGTTHQYLSQKFTEEPLHNIESQIESCKKKRKEEKIEAYEFGLQLFSNTKENLSLLKSILGTSNLKYKAIADQLANEIMQCGIDYFNESQENESNENYLESAQKLTRLADSIAVGKLTKDRAKDSLASLEEMKDRELSQVIELLESVRDSYETNEAKIRRQIKELEETDIQIIAGYKTINKTAVEASIRNSIDWSKVNDLIKAVLTDESLNKIKASSNTQLKEDFIKLAHWLKQFSRSNSIISSIIEKYKRIPPKLSFKIVSSQVQNIDQKSAVIKKPLYTKFIKYIRLKLNLEVTKDTSVTFYLKYITPNGSIKRNSRTSPIGYSQAVIKELSKESDTIDLLGWGNSEKCTYDVGQHRIEVYVDEYLIHTHKFTVDLAPSEKIEKELANAQQKLREINRTEYFASEIKVAKNELTEINKFKWFRGSFEKQKQVESQQKKIDLLLERSRKEKAKNLKTEEEKINDLKMKLSAAIY